MNFPDSSHKAEQYYISGQMLANVAAELADTDPNLIAEPWGSTMQRLATADRLAEDDATFFLSGKNLIDYLGLDTENNDLVLSADGLLVAAAASTTAATVQAHFIAREQEALHTTGILFHQSPEVIRGNGLVRSQIGYLAIAGIQLDSLCDAKQDSLRLGQFTALQLAMGSFQRFVKSSAHIQPVTWGSILRQSHRFGFDKHMVKKASRPFTPSFSFAGSQI